MDLFEFLKVILLGVVQGITEWLPVSSTGHLILVDEFIKLQQSPLFISTFLVVIQFGSILAVLVLYFEKLNPFDHYKTKQEKSDTVSLWLKVLVAVIPSGVIGLLYDDTIDALFYNATVISIALIAYGVLFILVENDYRKPKINHFHELTYQMAICIGLFQVLALIPGTSRSGATIIGAVLLGASRFIAAEFSFFLAIPTMLGASALKLLKSGFDFTGTEWLLLLTGSVVAFAVSIFAIKFLMDYIKQHDFKVFGYYRIILGIILLVYFYLL